MKGGIDIFSRPKIYRLRKITIWQTKYIGGGKMKCQEGKGSNKGNIFKLR